MSRPLLAVGAKGPYVVECQELINKWSEHEYGKFAEIIKTDGDFGSTTKRKVKEFQRSCFLYRDGMVGNNTWAALLGVERYNCFDLPLPFVYAPNKHQCWAGATAMLLNRGAPVTTEPPGVRFEPLPGGLTGGLDNSHANMQKYANFHNVRMFKAEPLTCLQLCNHIDQFGRAMINIKGVTSSMTSGKPEDSHLAVVAGVRGSGDPQTTTVTIYNPSASGPSYAVISRSYKWFKTKYPKLTYQLFYNFSNNSTPVYSPNVSF